MKSGYFCMVVLFVMGAVAQPCYAHLSRKLRLQAKRKRARAKQKRKWKQKREEKTARLIARRMAAQQAGANNGEGVAHYSNSASVSATSEEYVSAQDDLQGELAHAQNNAQRSGLERFLGGVPGNSYVRDWLSKLNG